ncbi:MAG: ATP-binding cassette domain-containing protein [bacterium]|nr:ATP-binding cassette domain-containing protein [bacterium]
MLQVKNVTKTYGKLKAVNDLSFEVNEGEIFGLLGLNGAGKTTMFRMIMGLLDQDKGDIILDGKKIDYNITDKIGFLTEERSLLTKMTVYDQVVYYGILKSMKELDIEKKLDYWLNKFSIKDYKYTKIKELSKGNQQKIQFITAIIHEPKLLILDEPFSGLDPLNVELFKKVILDFKKKGSIIIFSSHRMEHVELFCEKLVILVKGKSVIQGYLKDIKNNYQKRKIIVRASLNKEKVKKLDGVLDVELVGNEYVIDVKENKYIENIITNLVDYPNLTKLVVEEASLNEIFIAKVGAEYEK